MRWLVEPVYTCQHSAPNRCNFFLWDDDAKFREESAVLHNSRSEPGSTPQTPSSHHSSNKPVTPSTASRTPTFASPSKLTPGPRISQAAQADSDDEAAEFSDFSVNSDDERLLSETADRLNTSQATNQAMSMPPPETPRKAARTQVATSPGKRRRSITPPSDWLTPSSTDGEPDDDVFLTPTPARNLFPAAHVQSSPVPGQENEGSGMLSPSITPMSQRYKDNGTNGDPDIVAEVIGLLREKKVDIKGDILVALKDMLGRHARRAQGIAKGRDFARLAVKAKDVKIAELNYRVASLEVERETDRTVIMGLRREQASGRDGSG
ncbi:MAG: hypothetical protein M1837_003043 [Sclerophora amabilis]|nr:MAG: hypothetical protein M1837_003043 [Sclerophora amabilis]